MADIANLSDKIYKQKMNPLFELPVGDDVPNEINMLVETPMGLVTTMLELKRQEQNLLQVVWERKS